VPDIFGIAPWHNAPPSRGELYKIRVPSLLCVLERGRLADEPLCAIDAAQREAVEVCEGVARARVSREGLDGAARARVVRVKDARAAAL